MDDLTRQTGSVSFWRGILGALLGGVIGLGAAFWWFEYVLMFAGIGAGLGFLLGLFAGEWAIEHLKEIAKWV